MLSSVLLGPPPGQHLLQLSLKMVSNPAGQQAPCPKAKTEKVELSPIILILKPLRMEGQPSGQVIPGPSVGEKKELMRKLRQNATRKVELELD